MEYIVEFDLSEALIRSLYATGDMFANYDEKNEWCKENIKGNWQEGSISPTRRKGSFAFELEEDAMAFKLRWL